MKKEKKRKFKTNSENVEKTHLLYNVSGKVIKENSLEVSQKNTNNSSTITSNDLTSRYIHNYTKKKYTCLYLKQHGLQFLTMDKLRCTSIVG